MTAPPSHHNLCLTTLETFESFARWLEQRAEYSQNSGALLVGIGGSGGCGKSTMVRWLLQRLDGAEELPLDDFRLPRSTGRERGLFGSHPEANNLLDLQTCLQGAVAGKFFYARFSVSMTEKPSNGPRSHLAGFCIAMEKLRCIRACGKILTPWSW